MYHRNWSNSQREKYYNKSKRRKCLIPTKRTIKPYSILSLDQPAQHSTVGLFGLFGVLYRRVEALRRRLTYNLSCVTASKQITVLLISSLSLVIRTRSIMKGKTGNRTSCISLDHWASSGGASAQSYQLMLLRALYLTTTCKHRSPRDFRLPLYHTGSFSFESTCWSFPLFTYLDEPYRRQHCSSGARTACHPSPAHPAPSLDTPLEIIPDLTTNASLVQRINMEDYFGR